MHGKQIWNTSLSFALNGFQVGCNGLAHVISAGVLSDTQRDRECEFPVKKGGTTNHSSFSVHSGKDFFIYQERPCHANA